MIPEMSQPPPMPEVADAHIHLEEAKKAIERGLGGWNPDQLEDAIGSAMFFINKAEKLLNDRKRKTEES